MNRSSAAPRVFGAIIGTTAAIVFVGCTTAPAKLSLAGTSFAQQPVATNSVCIRLEALCDMRANPEALGAVGGRPFSSTDLMSCLEQALLRIRSQHYRLAQAGTDGPTGGPVLKVNLLKGYVDSIGLTKTAVIVLETELKTSADATPTKSLYRGQIAAMNWASGSEEVSDAVRSAIIKCIEQIKHDLDALHLAG